MLTLAVEDPPVTRRSSFADFVLRFVAAAVLIGSAIGFAVPCGVRLRDPLALRRMAGRSCRGFARGAFYWGSDSARGGRLAAQDVARRAGRSYVRLLALLAVAAWTSPRRLISIVIVGSMVSTLGSVTSRSEGNPHGPGVSPLKMPRPHRRRSHRACSRRPIWVRVGTTRPSPTRRSCRRRRRRQAKVSSFASRTSSTVSTGPATMAERRDHDRGVAPLRLGRERDRSTRLPGRPRTPA